MGPRSLAGQTNDFSEHLISEPEITLTRRLSQNSKVKSRLGQSELSNIAVAHLPSWRSKSNDLVALHGKKRVIDAPFNRGSQQQLVVPKENGLELVLQGASQGGDTISAGEWEELTEQIEGTGEGPDADGEHQINSSYVDDSTSDGDLACTASTVRLSIGDDSGWLSTNNDNDAVTVVDPTHFDIVQT